MKLDRFDLAHEVAFVDAVGVVVTENMPVVGSEDVRKKEGEIVANNLVLPVDPDFFAQNANPARTPEDSFVVSVLPQADLSAHEAYCHR
jgi:hypothetical protein